MLSVVPLLYSKSLSELHKHIFRIGFFSFLIRRLFAFSIRLDYSNYTRDHFDYSSNYAQGLIIALIMEAIKTFITQEKP